MNTVFLCARDISISEGALRAIVGFVIVLAVLMLLVGIFYLSGFFFQSDLMNKKPQAKQKQKEQRAAEPAENDERLVAAITAAIAVMLSEESGDEDVKPQFVIKRITRK